MRALGLLALAALLIAALLTACEPRLSDDDDSAVSDDDDSAISDDDDSDLSGGDSLKNGSLNICGTLPDSDPFEVLAASISGDALGLAVEYGGGCETHEFALCWDGLIAESAPPQISLNLIHDANNDGCLALVSELLEFDLHLLQENVSGGEVIVNVAGESLFYSF